MDHPEDQQATKIIEAYLDIYNLDFTGVFEKDERIPRTNTIRRVIRVISPEVIEILTTILDMDPADVIWKGITSNDTNGTQLWCTVDSTVGNIGVEQCYRIIEALPGYLEPREDNAYVCLIDVRVELQ